MVIKKTKPSEEEKLTDERIKKVIQMLETLSEKKWTKKECCEYLNISYNTTRLNSIIEKFKAEQERSAKKRSEKRGKPVTQDEAAYMIQSYLEGATVDAIEKSTYRGASLVKHTLEKYDCPIRARSPDYFKPELIPEAAMREKFNVGDTVYSARYDSIAKIKAEPYPGVYRIWLCSEKQQQFAYQEAAELASLEHLIAIGVAV